MKKVKKDVAFLCQFFYPEYVSSATLPYDVAEALAKEGYSVGALVGYPKEYSQDKNVPKREVHNGIAIKRVKYLQLKRTGFFGRLINYVSFFIAILFNMRFLKNYKAVIVYSNPPIIPLVAVIAKKLYKTKIIFVSFDVYPEIAIQSGAASENSLMTKVFKLINKALFKSVDKVVALSTDMRDFMLQHRKITEDRVAVIPNWYEDIGPTPYKEKNAETPFTISYLGNLGTCQDETTIMQVIDYLKDDSSVHFVFAGHGKKMDIIRQAKVDNQWNNVDIYGFLQGKEYKDILQASDCFLVTLTEGMLGLCSPSKTISYLMTGRPVICIMDNSAELAIDIALNDAGKVFGVGDYQGLSAYIKRLQMDDVFCTLSAQNARRIFCDKYRKSICMEKYVNSIGKVI